MIHSTEVETAKMVDIYVMGMRYQVPEGLTIMRALEYAGYRLIRGVGCRAGFCCAESQQSRAQNVP